MGLIITIVFGLCSRTRSTKSTDDETKWAPARKIIVRSIAKSYSTSFNAATRLMDFNYREYNLQNTDKVKGKSVYLENAQQDFQKSQKKVQLNNAALDANLMSIVSIFLESSESLLNKLKYYLLIHNDEFADRDFVSEPPFTELETIEIQVIKLREKYEDIFNDRYVVFTNLKTCEEIKAAWDEAAKYTNRLFFKPSNYQFKKGKIPFLYDIRNLKAISSKNIPNGVYTQVFSNN